MKERGKPSETGDRIQYVILDNGKELISEKAEDVEYFKQGLSPYKIDYDYYIRKQLYPPVERILEVIGSSKNLLKFDKSQKKLADYMMSN